MQTEPTDLAVALASFSDQWHPRIVATVNDYDVRVAKVQGEYVWHAHDDTDEMFLVISGAVMIDLRDGPDDDQRTVTLNPGSLFVVPKGIQHRPRAEVESAILLLEPTGTRTTGDYRGQVPDHITSTTGAAL